MSYFSAILNVPLQPHKLRFIDLSHLLHASRYMISFEHEVRHLLSTYWQYLQLTDTKVQ